MEEHTDNEIPSKTENDGDLQEIIGNYYRIFADWFSYEKDESVLLNLLRYLYKIPIAIFTLVLSPIMMLFVVIVFFASF